MEGIGMNPLLSPWSTSFRVRINHILTGEGNLIDCTTNTLRRNYHLLKDKQSVNDSLGPQVCGILVFPLSNEIITARVLDRLQNHGWFNKDRTCRRNSANFLFKEKQMLQMVSDDIKVPSDETPRGQRNEVFTAVFLFCIITFPMNWLIFLVNNGRWNFWAVHKTLSNVCHKCNKDIGNHCHFLVQPYMFWHTYPLPGYLPPGYLPPWNTYP